MKRSKKELNGKIKKAKFYCNLAAGWKLYYTVINNDTIRLYQTDNNGNIQFSFLGKNDLMEE